jgi:hypothetical protein
MTGAASVIGTTDGDIIIDDPLPHELQPELQP